jgi:hypothetical protein
MESSGHAALRILKSRAVTRRDEAMIFRRVLMMKL